MEASMATRTSGIGASGPDRAQFARDSFEKADFGDRRLNARAMLVLGRTLANPAASIPQQMGSAKDAKAAYRLFDHDAITFESMSDAHWQSTRQAARREPVVLAISDSSAICFGGAGRTPGLGPVSSDDHPGRGLWLHTTLAAAPGPADGLPRILGLLHQKIWARCPAPPGETRTQRRDREHKESERWAGAVREIGPLAECTVFVGDAESDLFEVFQACREPGLSWEWVIRSAGSASNRLVLRGHQESPGEKTEHLVDLARSLPALTGYTMHLRARPGREARTVDVRIAGAPVRVMPPTIWRQGEQGPVAMYLVRAWEAGHEFGKDEKNDEEKIEWLLLCSLPVDDAPGARRAVEWYSRRWLIEEFHKCLKTGCSVEARQLEHAERLKPLVALLSLAAVWLLGLREQARRDPEAPAGDTVPETYVKVLAAVRQQPVAKFTTRHFYREVAKLGGFMGRKGDGEPGWITLWRGWITLEAMVRGATAIGLGPRISYG
jgi:hypothetical protein